MNVKFRRPGPNYAYSIWPGASPFPQEKSGADYNTRLSQLSLHSLSNRRFIRDVVFLYNLINGHYNIDISDRLLFCKDRNVGYDLRKIWLSRPCQHVQ